MTEKINNSADYPSPSFFDKEGVNLGQIEVSGGIPLGIHAITNSRLGIGGAYGAWGASYDNSTLPGFVGQRLGEKLAEEEVMNLAELGFLSRHHTPELTDGEHLEVELEVGARILQQAAHANGWEPGDVNGVLIGMSCPISNDYVARAAKRAGIPEDALKVTVHKACDGSMGGLHLALNPELSGDADLIIAEALQGKKVLVGGIEALSRLTSNAKDKYALQLFGNGAGVIGIVPGETMKFLTGKSHENYDEEGLLQLRMFYPHSVVRSAT